jgi:hypothetical protein
MAPLGRMRQSANAGPPANRECKMIEPNRPAPSAPRPWLRLNRIDLLVVLGLTAIVALTGAFLLLADEVMEGGTKAFDQAILMALRSGQYGCRIWRGTSPRSAASPSLD